MREMKDSGIEWVGAIPVEWKCNSIRNLMISRDGGAWGSEPENESEGTICLRIADFDYTKGRFKKCKIEQLTRRQYTAAQIKKLMLKKGDILVEKSGGGEKTPVGRAVYYDGEYGDVLYANFMERLRFNCLYVNPIWMTYWLRSWYECKGSPYYINQTTGIQNINLSLMLAKEKAYYPDLVLQEKIIEFLDAKCAEIDALTADIQTQIDTLEQYKRSIITEAVTKGLNPDVEMKDSGNQYWGSIPTNWHLSDIKYLFEIVKRIAGKEGYDILSVTQKGIKIKDISNNEGQVAESYANYQFVYPGDFVMNHMDLLTGWVDCSKLFGVTSPDYRVFRLRDKNNSLNYYKYIMQTCYMNRIFYSLGQGVSNLGRWRLQTSSFNNFMVPVPPVEVQESIATYLDKKCTEINACIDDKQRQLEVLEEYKKSLIYEYVTGKKEVPAI